MRGEVRGFAVASRWSLLEPPTPGRAACSTHSVGSSLHMRYTIQHIHMITWASGRRSVREIERKEKNLINGCKGRKWL